MKARTARQLVIAAATYGSRGITVVPLALDEEGLPKKPMSDFYPRFKSTDNERHDWSQAVGLGIVLGRPSGGLAVIDVDDAGLAEYLLAYLLATPNPPLMARTARRKLHIYVQETAPFTPRWRDMTVQHQGRNCLVQLLASSLCQAAAPPTPGYTWIDPTAQPLFGQISDVWKRLSLEAGRYSRPARPWDFKPHERSNSFATAALRDAGS